MPDQTQAVPGDAVVRSWVERAPAAWRSYFRLARLDRPIGTWLLYWPCVFGLAVGAGVDHRGFLSKGQDWLLLVLFAIGSVAMRGAGCTYNDIVDRHIDARVARTRGRPIPSGAVTVAQAWKFAGAQCGIGLLILLYLNWYSVALGGLSLVLIALYPFMKRITWWPQAWLGLTFNWGALLGFAALTGRSLDIDLVLYGGCFFWTLGYDTIYALQDVEDDALAGIKSTARLFGSQARTWIFLFYVLALGLLAAAAGFAFHATAAVFMLPAGLHFLWQVRRIDPEASESSLRIFRSNRDAGALIAFGLIVGSWIPPVLSAAP
ncbi:MAG: 4-hydroxybenzoate octaprenyltransferase [Alphaproteobacteria bacterium]|nr:4-hydroxybenzoate octaprenyltransferase [Alphaproteobacteria bacterium]